MLSSLQKRLNRQMTTIIGLLVLVGFLGCCLYARYLVNVGVALSLATLAPAVILSVATVVAFGVTMILGIQVDLALPCVMLALSTMGITFAASLSVDGTGAYRYLLASIASLVVMMAVASAVRRLDAKDAARHKYALCALPLLMLLVPLLSGTPFEYGWGRPWFRMGPFSFNAGTWATLVALVSASCVIAYDSQVTAPASERHSTKLSLDGVFASLALIVLPAVALFEMGAIHMAAALLLCIAAMLYAREARPILVVAPIILLVLMLALRILMDGFSAGRIYAWLNPQADPWGKGYQVLQSLAAIRRGSITGTGIGLGTPDQVPIVQSDYVFAAVCEELGLLGGIVTSCLYALLAVRGLRLADCAGDRAASLMVVGLTCLTAIDSLTAVGCVVGLLPASGSALPYLSGGMNALLDMGVRLGIILGASTPTSSQEEGESQGLPTQSFQNRTHLLLCVLVVGFVIVGVRLATIVLL